MGRLDTFEQLDIWKTGKELAIIIYKITAQGKFFHDFGLRDQLRRSVVSIPSNIAEGFGRNNNNELIQFLKIAKGSCSEAITQLIIADEIGYIPKATANELLPKFKELNIKIAKFISYLRAKTIKKITN